MARNFLKKKFKDNAKKLSDLQNALKKEETDLLKKKNCFKQRRIFKKNRFIEKESN